MNVLDMSNAGKTLLNSLNRDPQNGYHPLEKYVIAIEQNWDNSNALRSIGERVGFFVPETENTQEGLYLKLKEYLDREKDPQVTQEIIHMSPDEYEEYLIKLHPSNKNLPRDQFYPLYSDRLYLSLSD